MECATVGGVRLPTNVEGILARLAGALRPSLGDLGPSLRGLTLAGNAITSVPAEIAALTGLEALGLNGNQLTGVPTDFRTVNPTDSCFLFGNQGFSCANVGAGTTCCNPDINGCGEGLPGGPCYAG